MRQHILATALAAAVSALAYGQNLNPTVEVTNAYEGGPSAIAKPAQQLAVPDSVTRFNLDFDYSVFEKPYQGAYEFTPYYVQLKPTPKPSTTEKFYLRAGAGRTSPISEGITISHWERPRTALSRSSSLAGK